MRGALLALCAAGVVALGAGQANAALVRAEFAGSYWSMSAPDGWMEGIMGIPEHTTPGIYRHGDIEIYATSGPGEGVNYVAGGLNWNASFVFDTDQGVLTEVPFGSSGGTYETLTGSPIVQGTFTSAFPTSFDLTGELLSISFGPTGLEFSLTGDVALAAHLLSYSSPPIVRDSYSLTDPLFLTHPTFPYFFDRGPTLYSDGTFTAFQGGVNFASLSPVRAIPEPRSWALLLLGFGGLGAALRGRRRRGLAANAL